MSFTSPLAWYSCRSTMKQPTLRRYSIHGQSSRSGSQSCPMRILSVYLRAWGDCQGIVRHLIVFYVAVRRSLGLDSYK